jgi:hypothetical protein
MSSHDDDDAASYWHPYFQPCMSASQLLKHLDTRCFGMEMQLIDLRQLTLDNQAKQLFAMLQTKLVGVVVHQLCLPAWLGADLVGVAWFSETAVSCLYWPSMFDQTDFARQVVASCAPWLVTLVVPHGVDFAKMEAIAAGASVTLVRPSKHTFNALGASGALGALGASGESGASDKCTNLAKQRGTYAPHNT